MKLIISFSARKDGNCGSIARYIAGKDDCVVHFCELHARPCADCAYECFGGECKYSDDGVLSLYQSMAAYDQVVLIVPMYCGNPSSLYFTFNERGQAFFRTEKAYAEVQERLYIVGVYGSRVEAPDFIPGLEKWFVNTEYRNRVLGLERHAYRQKMGDSLLEVAGVRDQINTFLSQNTPGG